MAPESGAEDAVRRTRGRSQGSRRDTEGGQMVRSVVRAALGAVVGLATVGIAACGSAGSSGTKAPASVSGQGCAPVKDSQLMVLDDDKKLQTADNVIPAINTKVA